MFRIAFLLAYSALLVFCTSGTAAADPVKGDANLSTPGNYARLLLQFGEEVPTEISVAGSILVVRFAKPVDVSVDRLGDAVPAYVGSARRDPDGSAIRLALTQKVRVNQMAAGERVFIDLLPEKWVGLPPALPPEVVKELTERALAAERALRMQKQTDSAQKKPPVRVRTAVQPTFVRFVFELPENVSVSSSLNTDKFSLSFGSPLTFDLADAKVTAPANVKTITQKVSGDTSSVEIGLVGEVDVHAFREERNYVVDVGFDGQKIGAVQIPSLAQAGPPPAAPKTEVPKSEAARPDVPVVADAPLSAKPAPQVAVEAPAKPDDAMREPKAETKAETPPPSPETKTADAAEQSPPPVAVVAEPAAPSPPPSNPAAAILARRSSDDFRVTFPFGAATPFAMFRRSDAIWLVAADPRPLNVDAIRNEGGSLVADVSTIAAGAGQAVRIKLTRPLIPSLGGDNQNLVLTLSDKEQPNPQPLVALRNIADPSQANVSVALNQPGGVVKFGDPDAGDTLMVVTAPMPIRGFVRPQNFVEFSILESAHGVVVQPNSDDISVKTTPEKVIISRPGGLTLSASNNTPERASLAPGSAFDVNEWNDNQKAPFLKRFDELMNAAAFAQGDDKISAHLALARFYMSRGMYHEAKAIIDLALSGQKNNDTAPTALIVRAVAEALANRPELAMKDLADPAIGGNFDSQLWQALASARLGKWSAAREKFKNADLAISSQPLDLQRIILLDAMRASLEVKDYSGATTLSNELQTIGVLPEQTPALTLMRGRLAESLGRDKDALANYHEVAETSDRPSAADAVLAEVTLRQKRGEISDDEALNNLETLSAMWRGDAREIKTLQLLSRLYVNNGRYADALSAARIATQIQPNSDISRGLQDDASALFSQIFLTSKGDDLEPIKALGLFYQYRDLTPIGRRGDEMIRRLADRLVAVDLLEQASELLQYQVDHRLEGAARAQVAARLAMIYLMNRKPDRAIAALRSTRIADLAGELRQQRLLLESRAQSDIGRNDLALDIIANLSGRETVRLRSDIYWAMRQWRESAEQIEVLYGDRWRDFQPLTDFEKGDIIRAEVGYALAGDALGLARFREKYAPKMDSNSDRALFDAASKPAAADGSDLSGIAKIAASVDTLEGFLREMKTRFPEAVARAKPLPDMKNDADTTGSLPAIVGRKTVGISR